MLGEKSKTAKMIYSKKVVSASMFCDHTQLSIVAQIIHSFRSIFRGSNFENSAKTTVFNWIKGQVINLDEVVFFELDRKHF